MKRFISILVAVMMVLTLLPLGRVFAEEEMRGPKVDPTTIEEKFETNKKALKAKIDEARGIDLTKYEDGDEKNTFTKAIEEAETVYALTEVTEEAIGKMQAETAKLAAAITTFKENAKEVEENPEPEDKLKKAKETAKTQIDSLGYLSETEKNSYKTEIDNANSDEAISEILERAKAKNTENKAEKEKAKLEEAKTKAEKEIKALTKLTDEEKAPFLKQVKDATKVEDVEKTVEAARKADTEKQDPPVVDKLAEAKAKAEKEITALTKLTDEEKAPFLKQVKDAETVDAVNAALEAAKKADNDKQDPKPEDKLAEAKAKAEKEIKALTKLTDKEKASFIKQVKDATTVADVEKAVKDAKDADDKKTTPSVPSDDYSTRVPRAIRTTIANANAMIAHPRYGFASYSSRANLENRLSSLKSIANDFENGYYNKYWNGKFLNGYYGDEWYDYYENGYYYRNGVPYTYSGFRAHFGYYPKYDMSDYYGRGYWNGKYRRGYYRDGWYDYYENGYYYRDGERYTYSEFRKEFGYYPSYAYGRGYWYDYAEDRDPYYGYQGRYGYYYGSSIRDAVERTVNAINAVAISADAPLMKVSYPSSSDYDGYYDYYPWYYDPYYYDGYYYDQNSSKIRELKKLIGEAEELAASRSDAQWAPYRSELTDAANYGRKAAKGRASVKGAIEELEKAIKKAKTDGMKLYIRRGYMTGVNGTEFNPSGTLTRAEMAQIIENLLEQSGDTVAFAPKNFNDVESGRWYKKAVNLVSSHNIMKGNPDGNFYPQKPVSIEELIVIAARLGGHTPQNGNVFGIEKHYWSVHYIQTAYVKGWIGMDKFNPSAPITRGQAVQILNRSLNFGVDKEFINKYGAQMNKFSDVTMSSPYYYDIVAATNTISYSQVPKSKTRIWRAYQTSNGWSSSKYSNGTYVKPYTGW